MNMYLVSTKDGNIIHTVQVRGGCLSDIEKAQDRLPEWTHSVTIGSCVTVTLGKTTSSSGIALCIPYEQQNTKTLSALQMVYLRLFNKATNGYSDNTSLS